MSYNFKETMTRSGNGLLLCSYKIGFKHPKTHKKMEIEMSFVVFMKGTKQSSETQQDVWKFLHLHIHTQHGKTATFTMHLKMQGQHSAVLKALTKR